jgi:glutathione reductase (NADPH)
MTRRYDVVVIGSGTAASTVASRCRAAGWTIAVVDSRPFGGTCALRGCDPKKILVGATEAVEWVRRLSGKGLESADTRIDWSRLVEFKRSLIADVPKSRETGFRNQGIDTFHGRATFSGPTAVVVGDDVLEGRYVVVAAGARPATVRMPGAEHLVTSEQFLELDRLPSRIVFVGGGYISFEFAHVAARAGATVSILHRGVRPLPLFEPDLVEVLVARTRTLGIDIHLGTEVTRIDGRGEHFQIEAITADQTRGFAADMVVHGAGRVPEIDDLGLDAAGVAWDITGVRVNEYLQSVSNPSVYAAGDAAANGGPRLTPVAGYDGRIVAANVLKGNHAIHDYTVVPSVVFTIPPLASVGLHERDARERGLRFTTHYEQTNSWYSSRRIAESASGFKVLVEEESERVLGAHLLGPDADEVINLFAMAMRSGMRAHAMKEMVFSYPTVASDIPYMV